MLSPQPRRSDGAAVAARGIAGDLSFGLTHVAALLWFAGAVVFIKGEVDRPWPALGLFAAVGAVLFVAGRLIRRLAP